MHMDGATLHMYVSHARKGKNVLSLADGYIHAAERYF